MSIYKPGDWLSAITDPTFLVNVLEVSADGNVAVIANGQRVNTSARYLANTYRHLGATA